MSAEEQLATGGFCLLSLVSGLLNNFIITPPSQNFFVTKHFFHNEISISIHKK